MKINPLLIVSEENLNKIDSFKYNIKKKMRIFNGTNARLDIPLTGMQRIQVNPKSVSGDFLPSNDFLSVLVTGYDYNEVALIVSGPFEINLCSSVPGCVGFVVQSVEEAIERFNPKKSETVEVTKEEIVEEPAEETPAEIKAEVTEQQEEVLDNEPVAVDVETDEEVAEEEAAEELKEEAPKKKNNKKGKKG